MIEQVLCHDWYQMWKKQSWNNKKKDINLILYFDLYLGRNRGNALRFSEHEMHGDSSLPCNAMSFFANLCMKKLRVSNVIKAEGAEIDEELENAIAIERSQELSSIVDLSLNY